MVYCCIKNCKNSYKTSQKRIKFHRFPKCEETRKKWLSICKKDNINMDNARICSQHFNPKSYTKNGNLNQFAVPNNCPPKVIIDFENICRFCLKKEPHMKPIISNDDADHGISEMIEFCLGIQILTDDKLPKFLCEKCHNELLHCKTFHEKCLSAEEKLKQILQQNDKQNKYDHSVFTTTIPIKTDPLDISCTENIKEICTDSVGEPTTELKDHIDNCGEILLFGGESNIQDDISLNCINDDEIIKKPIRTERKGICPICGKLVRRVKVHMETHSGIKKHKCPHCNKKFTTKSHLTEHINGHFDLRLYKCNYCDKAYNSQKGLTTHISGHIKEEKYECNICGRKFIYETTYRYHMRVHNQIKKYKCDICNREFITKYHLRKHYRIHTGEKPYKCKQCDKCFRQSGTLSEHCRKVHRKEISYYCDKCNAGFVYKLTLNNHLRKCQ